MNQIRVAVVEDNPKFRIELRQLLEGAAGILCVGTFATCGDLIASGTGNKDPHVVLMDMGLRPAPALAALKAIKLRWPKAEVVMLTAYEHERQILESLSAGAAGYILKSSPGPRILEAVRDVHAGGAPVTARFARRLIRSILQSAPQVADDYHLSRREQDILAGLVAGMSYKMIADQHAISVDTVRSHIRHVYDKLKVHSKSEAVVKALKDRLV